MKLLTKLVATSLCMLLMQTTFASEEDLSQSSPPQDCSTPCAKPAPCAPKPCPPKPCKPCPPVCFERGYPNEKCCFPGAYNEPANFDLGPSPWDFWIDASFTYWDAQQEGMELAQAGTAIEGTFTAPTGSFLSQNRQYKPGFKVGLGMDMNHDAWSGLIEYTWFRSNVTTSRTAAPTPTEGEGVWNVLGWYNSSSSQVFATSLSSKWRVHMDLLDAAFMRPYYQGKNLIIAPFGGLRGQWIRQKLSLTGGFVAIEDLEEPLNGTNTNKSNSWAVGPRAGFLGKWHLGWGFRFEGDVAGSILYTRYTSIKTNLPASITVGSGKQAGYLSNYNCLRAVNEMNVGIGWGSYFDCRNYHFDLLATYDFQVFWNQNMMRFLADATQVGTGAAAANLYLQGLTIKAQMDF